MTTDATIPMHAGIQTCLAQLYAQNHQVRTVYREKVGRDLVLTGSREKEWAMIRELVQRRRKFQDAARMTRIEWLAMQNYATFLVDTFHDLAGTPEEKRPQRAQYVNAVMI